MSPVQRSALVGAFIAGKNSQLAATNICDTVNIVSLPAHVTCQCAWYELISAPSSCCDWNDCPTQALDVAGVPRDSTRARIIPAHANARNLKEMGRKAQKAQLMNVMNMVECTIEEPGLPKTVMFMRSIPGAVVQLLCDPCVSGPNSEHLDFGQARRDGEMSGCQYLQLLQSTFECDKDGGRPYMATLCFFADGVAVDSGFVKSYTPVSITLAQHSLDVRLSREGSVLIG